MKYFLKNLPDFLPNDVIVNYLKKYRDGNLEAKEIIIKHNLKLVLYMVKRLEYVDFISKEDFFSVGVIGLIKAIETFDLDMNNNFSTYAGRCIENELRMLLRYERRHYNVYSLDEPISSEGEDTFVDFVEDEKDYSSIAVDNAIIGNIGNMINSLPELDKKIILLYFGFINNHPLTQVEIAKKFNLSRTSISKHIEKSLKILRKQLGEKNLTATSKSEKIVYFDSFDSNDYENADNLALSLKNN